jgi:hypothetical protein
MKTLRATATILALSWTLTGCETLVLMPTAEKPYRLTTNDNTLRTQPTGWTWVDGRSAVAQDNTSTRDGVVFGDAVMQPRPYPLVQHLFHQAVLAHPESAALQDKLRGQTLRLENLELAVGLWNRLSERQAGQWEFVRVTVLITIDGRRYEAKDVHKFNNSDKPSPLNTPLKNAVDNLVEQIHLF